MYLKFPNAAVYIVSASEKPNIASQQAKPSQIAGAPSITLWSDRPFTLSVGRLVGVRKTGASIELALMPTGKTSLVWLPADGLLTKAQVNRWLSTSSFRPQR